MINNLHIKNKKKIEKYSECDNLFLTRKNYDKTLFKDWFSIVCGNN